MAEGSTGSRGAVAVSVALLVSVACSAFAAAPAADPVCKVVFEAGEKLPLIPHHAYQTTTTPSGGSKEMSEAILVNGGIYVRARGKWKKSPITTQQRQQQEQENIRNARNLSCRHLRDEAVEGELAAVYSAHVEVADALKADSIVWISRSSGHILKQEEDLDQGDVKRHVSVRYEYGNVQAPAAER